MTSLPAAPVRAPPLVAMRGICKSFGAVRACDAVDLHVDAGEILGVLGENGAGKTSLMSVLFGTYGADAGHIEMDGRPVRVVGPADALRLGIGMVHQHFQLVPRHTVLENLLVGRRSGPTRALALDRLAAIGRDYRLILDPAAIVGNLSVGERQRVEIAKALVRGARVLVLDEPTASLTPDEARGLFDALRAMAARGLGVILISHRLGEVLEVTHRITVLRHGRVVAERRNDGTLSRGEITRLMVGRDPAPPRRRPATPGRVLLSLAGVRAARQGGTALRDVSLDLRAGEVLGIAGVAGNGQRELADVVAGVLRLSAGRVVVDGAAVPRPDPRRMQALGVGRVPEDRLAVGMIPDLTLAESMALPRISGPPFSRFGVIDRRALRRFAEAQIQDFDIRTSGPDARAGDLSGGNLQKAMLARELAWKPKVLLAAQPTRGIDVGAAEIVHGALLAVRGRGGAVLLITEDLEELFALSDRIAVMSGGCILAEMTREAATVERIGMLMAGVVA